MCLKQHTTTVTHLYPIEASLDAVQCALTELLHAGLDLSDGHLVRHREGLPARKNKTLVNMSPLPTLRES